MKFLTLTLATLTTSTLATPLLLKTTRDQFPSIPAISALSNKIVELPGTASDVLDKRSLAVAMVDTSSNRIMEHEGGSGAAVTRRRHARDFPVQVKRDDFPALVAVSSTGNHLVEITGTAADVPAAKKRELAIPAVSQTLNRVVEIVGGSSLGKREAEGVVPVVVVGGGDSVVKVVSMGEE